MFRATQIVALLISLCAGTAHADIIYDIFFRSTSTFGDGLDTTFMVTPGQSITGVEAVLRETVTGASTSIIGATNVNAYAADVSVSGSDGSFSNLALVAGFDDAGFAATANDADTLNFAALGDGQGDPGLPSTAVSATVRELVMGTVDFVAPTSGSSTFTLSDFSPADGDFVTFGLKGTGPTDPGTGLESESVASGGSFNGRSITLDSGSPASVPEPSSLLMLSSVIGIGVYHRRRRLKKAAQVSKQSVDGCG